MQVLNAAEIDAAEATLGARLPTLYRQLLGEIGHGRHGDAEIYHPAGIRELWESFFEGPGQLFAPYFPFGCDNRLQEVWVIDAAAERAAAIWHETVPDDWPDEQWLGYDAWRQQYLGMGQGS
jgi:hypothetical protein